MEPDRLDFGGRDAYILAPAMPSLACLYLIPVVSLSLMVPAVSAQETPAQTSSEAQASETAGGDIGEEASDEFAGVRLIQPNRILFTMIDFREYAQVRQIHEQMLSIPGLTDFIPQLEAPGLLTYDLRYSGPSELLIQALQDVFGAQYEIAMKEMGDDEWEFTMRRSSRESRSY